MEKFSKPDQQLAYALREDHELGIVNLSESTSPVSNLHPDNRKTNAMPVETKKYPPMETRNASETPIETWKTNEPAAMDRKTSTPQTEPWKTANTPPLAGTRTSTLHPAAKSHAADPSGIYELQGQAVKAGEKSFRAYL